MFKRFKTLWWLLKQPELIVFLQWLYMHEAEIVQVVESLNEPTDEPRGRTMWSGENNE